MLEKVVIVAKDMLLVTKSICNINYNENDIKAVVNCTEKTILKYECLLSNV